MHPDFNLPTRGRISGRTSSITASYFQAITPVIEPSDDEVETVIQLLGMSREHVVCAYCGDPRTEWDHFRPTVINREPTGYITEIANLVPACGKCNQSKGNKNWKDWMLSDAKKSPKTRQIPDLDDRIKKLELFELWKNPVKIDYKSVIETKQWTAYIQSLETSVEQLRIAQSEATKLLQIINSHMEKST